MVENRSQKAKYFLISTVKALANGGTVKRKRKILTLERLMQKGTDILVALEWLAIEKKISMDVNNLKDLMKLEVEMPKNILGEICSLVAKSFKLTVALKDDIIRFKILGILGDSIRILIGIRFTLYRGEKIDSDIIRYELNGLKKELEKIINYDISS